MNCDETLYEKESEGLLVKKVKQIMKCSSYLLEQDQISHVFHCMLPICHHNRLFIDETFDLPPLWLWFDCVVPIKLIGRQGKMMVDGWLEV